MLPSPIVHAYIFNIPQRIIHLLPFPFCYSKCVCVCKNGKSIFSTLSTTFACTQLNKEIPFITWHGRNIGYMYICIYILDKFTTERAKSRARARQREKERESWKFRWNSSPGKNQMSQSTKQQRSLECAAIATGILLLLLFVGRIFISCPKQQTQIMTGEQISFPN